MRINIIKQYHAGLQYLGVRNRTCSNTDGRPDGLSAGPLLKPSLNESGPWKWGQWRLSKVRRDAKGTYRAIISNHYDKEIDKPRCLGSVAVSNPALCTNGSQASRVQLRREDPQGG